MPENSIKLNKKSNILTTDEIIRLVNIFAMNGVNKIRLTGGEPTIRKDLLDIIRKLTYINFMEKLKMVPSKFVPKSNFH